MKVSLVRDDVPTPASPPTGMLPARGAPGAAGQGAAVHSLDEAGHMERIRVSVPRPGPRRPSPLDVRTPSGRPLPTAAGGHCLRVGLHRPICLRAPSAASGTASLPQDVVVLRAAFAVLVWGTDELLRARHRIHR